MNISEAIRQRATIPETDGDLEVLNYDEEGGVVAFLKYQVHPGPAMVLDPDEGRTGGLLRLSADEIDALKVYEYGRRVVLPDLTTLTTVR